MLLARASLQDEAKLGASGVKLCRTICRLYW